MTGKTRILHIIIAAFLLSASCVNLISAETNELDYQNILNFQPLSEPPEPIRQVAEFEPMEGVLIRYSFGISYEIIAEMAEDVEVVTIVASSSQQNSVISQYQNNGVNLNHCSFLIAPSDSYWTRDYGPWFAFTGNDELGVVDFIYNRPRPNDNAIPSAYATDQGLPYYYMPLEHAGGNYMTDGQGISVSTDLVWTENPGYTHEQINEIVENYLGITTYHVVPDVNGQYIKHIDCWGKYLAPDVIMIREVPPSHSQYDEIEAAVDYFESQISCYDTPYEIARVYTPNNQPYTNSLILNDKVLVPITGSQWDDDAIASYQAAMPGYEVLGFTNAGFPSWQSTDALHCRAKGIPDREMLYIEHTPLYGVQNGDTGVDIQAKIVPYSEESLISDSTRVYWKEENGTWDSVQMTPLGNAYYHAIIYPQEDGSTAYYYIHAEDNSGRSENHPYIGEEGAHSFIVNITATNNPPEKPSKPSGETQGQTGTSYPYSTSAIDPDGDKLEYGWDWDGDNTVDEWDNNNSNYYPSGAPISTSHAWPTDGTYNIKVKAKDIYGEESEWSDPLSVTMPKNKEMYFTLLDFLERFFPQIYLLFSKLLQF